MSQSSLRALVGRAVSRLSGARPQPDTHARELKAMRALLEQILHRVERLEKPGKAKDAAADMRAQLDAVRQRLDALVGHEKTARKVRSNTARQVTSLVRAQYLVAGLAAPAALMGRRFRLHSQHEEDGIVLALLEAAGVTGRRFLEIGSGSSGGNSGVLAFELGWTGLMVEARTEQALRLHQKLAHNPQVSVADVMVTPGNVNELIRSHGLSGEIDLLSLDIDSIDYWVFEAIEACNPRVVVLEYNALLGPDRAVTIPATGMPAGAPGVYAGASLAALDTLARRKGYGLVLCEDTGINAFFLRDGLAPHIPRLTVAAAYRPRHTGADEARDPADVLREIERAGLALVDV